MFDFIFADSPFNIGQKYNGYNDNMSPIEFQAFTTEWIRLSWAKLKPGCAIFLHGSAEMQFAYYEATARLNIFQYLDRKLIWGYNFGQNQYSNWTNTHAEIMVLRKPGTKRWNFDAIAIPSERLLGGDKRTETAKHKGMVTPGSVWGLRTDELTQVVTENDHGRVSGEYRWGRVQGNNRERRAGHPNQLPERYLQRAISGNTYPGDTIYDPFGGTGTTAVVANGLQRNAITTDISEWNCQSIRERLEIGMIE